MYYVWIGPICEEPGKIKNGYATVFNGSPDNTLQDDARYNMGSAFQGNSVRDHLHGVELQQLEYKCNKGFVLWGIVLQGFVL